VFLVSPKFKGVADEIPASVHGDGLVVAPSFSGLACGNFRGGGLWLESLPSGRLAITTKIRIPQVTNECQGLIWLKFGGGVDVLDGQGALG